MLSTAFETVAYVPSYTRWLAEQDWTETYARHKKNLQLIGLHDQDRRWVLKSPSHVFAIDEIMSVYPDALSSNSGRGSSYKRSRDSSER